MPRSCEQPRRGARPLLVLLDHQTGLFQTVKDIPVRDLRATTSRIRGRDFADTIAAGPDDLIGQHVFGTGGDLGFTRDGTHAEFVVIPPVASRSLDDAADAYVEASHGGPRVVLRPRFKGRQP
jgi:hypothetical protein